MKVRNCGSGLSNKQSSKVRGCKIRACSSQHLRPSIFKVGRSLWDDDLFVVDITQRNDVMETPCLYHWQWLCRPINTLTFPLWQGVSSLQPSLILPETICLSVPNNLSTTSPFPITVHPYLSLLPSEDLYNLPLSWRRTYEIIVCCKRSTNVIHKCKVYAILWVTFIANIINIKYQLKINFIRWWQFLFRCTIVRAGP